MNKTNDKKKRASASRTNSQDKGSNKKDYTKSSRSDSPVMRKASAINNIIEATSTIAVRNIGGNPIEMPATKPIGANLGTASTSDITIPGVVSLSVAPVFGKATGVQTDPVNLAARNMWMNLRSLYSNRIPYTAGAIVMYSMALDSILMCYQHLKRAYGIVFAYDARNKYVPDALLVGMGIDPITFRSNLPDVKVFLNKVATQMSAFGVPTELQFMLDHIDIVSHIYVDGQSANAQYIVTRPEFLWKMDWTNNKLTTENVFFGNENANAASWSDIKDRFEGIIEAFVNNEDVYMIASDMLRLYGNLAMLTPVDSNYSIGPEYDPSFLWTIHNATVVNFENVSSGIDGEIYEFVVTEEQAPENVGAITATYSTGFTLNVDPDNMRTNGAAAMLFTPGIFDFGDTNPTTEDFIKAANWKTAIEIPSLPTKAKLCTIKYTSTGTLMLRGINFVVYGDVSGVRKLKRIPIVAQLDASGSPGNLIYTDYELMEKWNLHPFLYGGVVTFTHSSNKLTQFGVEFNKIFGDTDQYVVLSVDEINRIHEAIILDKFDAAGVGTLNLRAK